FDCRLPGVTGECQCCSSAGQFAGFVGCCNPSSLFIPMPGNSGFCIAMGCPGPYQCGEGAECQADDSCCALAGGEACALVAPISTPLVPCCPGLVCSAPMVSGAFEGFTCCAPGPGCCAPAGNACSF